MTRALLILLLFSLALSTFALAQESPEEILKKADEVRNPSDSFFMKVKVSDPTGQNASAFEVFTQGKEKTLIKTMAPARDKGRNMLMLQENMWAFIPNLKRAVRVSLAQKLTGQAANGDISRMRWSGDYLAKMEKEDAKSWTLFLTAVKKGLTYEKIRVQIEKKSYHPLTAEFLSLSGMKLKLAEFSNYQQMAGAIRPAQMKIQSATNTNEVSVITIQEMKTQNFNNSLFDQDNLR